ncbi:MAG: hypothetical protein MUD01_00205 [Chloroflexaceae bacterium]|nr:hypothetical protein [Chloroflexaceae bacterium]
MNAETTPVRPVEQTAVTFFDLPCLAVRSPDGSIYLSPRDICAALNLWYSSQLRRIRGHTQLSKGLVRFLVVTVGGLQDQDLLHLQVVATWLLLINTARVAEPVRQRLDYLQW